MAEQFGVNFVPGSEEQNGDSQATPLQRAVQFLSLRLPRVSGAAQGALAPDALLQSRGGGGMLTGGDQQVSLGGGMSPEMLQALIRMAGLVGTGMPGAVGGSRSQGSTPMDGPGRTYDPAKPLDSLLGGMGGGTDAGGTRTPRFIPGDEGDRRRFDESQPQPDVIDRTTPGYGNRTTDPNAPRFRGGPFAKVPFF